MIGSMQSFTLFCAARDLSHRLHVLVLITILFQTQAQAQYPESDFKIKAEVLIKQTADKYRPPSMEIGDPEKYYWPKTIARFDKYGVTDSLGNAWITAMKDNSPFHFTLLGMARLMQLYPHAPAIKAHRLAILKKVFERTDNYNAWTSEGTENHTSMSRTSGYLFAQEALHFPDKFPEAPQKIQQMKDWILAWSEKALVYGTGEWNSAIYTAYNLCGFLNLYDFAKDEEVRLAAEKVLDFYAAEMALYYSFGIIGGAEMRGNGAVEGDYTATRYLAWLWFGEATKIPFFSGSQYIQALHAVTSAYRPDTTLFDLAHKNFDEALWVAGSKPSYLFEETHFVKQYFCATESYTLGTAVSPYGGWTGGNYQLVNWKLVAKSEAEEPWQISGNGLTFDEYSGKARDPFSQYFQHKNTFILVHHPPKNTDKIIAEAKAITADWSKKWRADFDKRFPVNDRHEIVNFNKNVLAKNAAFLNLPTSAKLEIAGNYAYIALPHTYLAVRILGSKSAVSTFEEKVKKLARQILQVSATQGRACGFILEAFDKTDFTSWADFKETYQVKHRISLNNFDKEGMLTYTNFYGDEITFEYVLTGSSMEALVDWGFGPTGPMVALTAPPFKQPEWPQGKGWGRVPQVKVNGKEIDFSASAPVYNGEGILVEDGKIEVDLKKG